MQRDGCLCKKTGGGKNRPFSSDNPTRRVSWAVVNRVLSFVKRVAFVLNRVVSCINRVVSFMDRVIPLVNRVGFLSRQSESLCRDSWLSNRRKPHCFVQTNDCMWDESQMWSEY